MRILDEIMDINQLKAEHYVLISTCDITKSAITTATAYRVGLLDMCHNLAAWAAGQLG